MNRLTRIVFLAAAMTLPCGAPMAADAEAPAAPLITLEGIVVEPAQPAADTLCRLKVKLRNRGGEIGSQLGFEVKINGQELVVYRNQLFMYPLPPDSETELQLFNFWSTETARPMPADGKLRLEVSLKEARWWKVGVDEEGVEVWDPIGPVEGLPSAQSVVLEMSR